MEENYENLKFSFKKPPIGVSPSWYVIPNRIKELANAISRYSEHNRICHDKDITNLIRELAEEIICHCDTVDKIQDIRERDSH